MEAQGHAAPVRAHGPDRHGRHGADRPGLDSGRRDAHGLYEYLQAVQGYLAPPIFVVFFFGVFFKRLNAKGCFGRWWSASSLGVFRMLVDTPVTLKLPGFEDGYTPGLVPLDRQQHQLPVLQRADHARLGGGDGGGELPDAARRRTSRSRA